MQPLLSSSWPVCSRVSHSSPVSFRRVEFSECLPEPLIARGETGSDRTSRSSVLTPPPPPPLLCRSWAPRCSFLGFSDSLSIWRQVPSPGSPASTTSYDGLIEKCNFINDNWKKNCNIIRLLNIFKFSHENEFNILLIYNEFNTVS